MKINSKFLFFIFGCFFFIETINSKAMVRDDTSKSIERYGNMHNDEKKEVEVAYSMTDSNRGIIVYTGSCGENATWRLNTFTGELSITGTGNIKSYEYVDEQPWYNYRIFIKKIVIADGITSIGYGSFYECFNVTEVEIANTVSRIEGYSFQGCVKLSFISFPNSVEYIGAGAFYNSGLVSVNVPSTVEEIGQGAFASCISLFDVKIDANIKSLADYMFNNCVSLKQVNLPLTLKYIGSGAFDNCISLTYFDMPVNIIDFGDSVFGGCENLKEINLHSGIEYIGFAMFAGCKNLEELTLPQSVKYISDYAFYGCESLKFFVLKENVMIVGSNSFRKCTGMQYVMVSDSIKQIARNAFDDCSNYLVFYGYTGTEAELFTKEKDFKFIAYDNIDNYKITIDKQYFVYDGNRKEPNVSVIFGDKELEVEKDYTVSYENNLEVGEGNVKISGKMPYFFNVNQIFKIEAKDIKWCQMTLDNELCIYDGKEKRPNIKIYDEKRLLQCQKDYSIYFNNNIDAGQAIVEVTGIGNYKGNVEKIFQIEKAEANITAESYKKHIGSKSFRIKAYVDSDSKLFFTSSSESVATITMDGKVFIRGIGKTIITIKSNETKNYKSSMNQILVIVNPKKAKLYEIRNEDSQRLEIKWKKENNVTGYEIYCANDMKFNRNLKKIVIKSSNFNAKKIKVHILNRKYFVKMRLFKVVGGKKYYGEFSTIKSIIVR